MPHLVTPAAVSGSPFVPFAVPAIPRVEGDGALVGRAPHARRRRGGRHRALLLRARAAGRRPSRSSRLLRPPNGAARLRGPSTCSSVTAPGCTTTRPPHSPRRSALAPRLPARRATPAQVATRTVVDASIVPGPRALLHRLTEQARDRLAPVVEDAVEVAAHDQLVDEPAERSERQPVPDDVRDAASRRRAARTRACAPSGRTGRGAGRRRSALPAASPRSVCTTRRGRGGC